MFLNYIILLRFILKICQNMLFIKNLFIYKKFNIIFEDVNIDKIIWYFKYL